MSDRRQEIRLCVLEWCNLSRSFELQPTTTHPKLSLFRRCEEFGTLLRAVSKAHKARGWRSKLQSILGRCHDYGLKRSSPISGNWRAFLEYIRQYYPQNLITGYRPSDMATEDYGRRCVCVCVQYGANPPKLAYGNRSMGTNLLR